MVNTRDTKATYEAKAFVQAELDRILEQFGESLRRGTEAAELLMMTTDPEYKHTQNSRATQHCSSFSGPPSADNRQIRARA
jgi:hypothetical protein